MPHAGEHGVAHDVGEQPLRAGVGAEEALNGDLAEVDAEFPGAVVVDVGAEGAEELAVAEPEAGEGFVEYAAAHRAQLVFGLAEKAHPFLDGSVVYGHVVFSPE